MNSRNALALVLLAIPLTTSLGQEPHLVQVQTTYPGTYEGKPAILGEMGTGFLVSDRHLLTNEHVVRNFPLKEDAKIEVRFGLDGEWQQVGLLKVDKDYDLALLLLPEPSYEEPVCLADYGGGEFKIVGYKGGTDFTEVEANLLYITNHAKRNIEGEKSSHETSLGTLVMDEPVFSGMSGGPIYNEDGCVVGIVWGSTEDESRGTYSIAISSFLLDSY